MRTWKLSLALLFTLTACQFNKSRVSDAPQSVNGTEDAKVYFDAYGEGLELNEISIINDQFQPLINAKVLIGTSKDNPFPGNTLTTNKEGKIKIPTQWTKALPLTITAEGHITATYLERLPEPQVLQVKVNRQVKSYEVKGKTLDYGKLKKDGFIDFSVVTVPLTNSSALNFDLNNFISSEVDIIKVMGYKVGIPSNISIPKQKETYILPVTLDKLIYRFYFSESGSQSLLALRSRFPFEKVIDKMRNGATFFDVINDFKYQAMEVRDFNLTGKKMQLDLNTKQYKMTVHQTVQAPKLDTNSALVTVGLIRDGSRYLPTDFKSLTSGQQMNISFPANTKARANLFALTKKKKKRDNGINIDPQMSLALLEASGQAPTMLSRIEEPVISKTGISLSLPAKKGSIQPLATYAALTSTQVQTFSQYNLKSRTTVWEIYADGWQQELNLPEALMHITMKTESQWNIALFGQAQEKSQLPLSPWMLEEATHVTRNATSF